MKKENTNYFINYYAIIFFIIFVTLYYCTANAETSITCPKNIDDQIEDSVVLIGSGNCYLTNDAKILNEVSVSAGVSFIVKGFVEGNINETGVGDVEVTDGGVVKGEIIEIGEGSLKILEGAMIAGSLNESGAGGLEIYSSVIKGDVEESGAGQIRVNASTIEGNVLERSAGSIEIIASAINNNVSEFASGDINIDSSSYVRGYVSEKGQGTCQKIDHHVVNGKINCD